MGGLSDDVQRSETGRVLFLDEADPIGATDTDRVQPSKARPLIVGLVTVLSLALLGGVYVGSRESQMEPDPETAAELPASDGSEAAAAVADAEEEVFRPYGTGEIQRDNRYSEIDSAIGSVVVAGALGQNLPLFGPTLDIGALPIGIRSLDSIELDASGNWLAGTYRDQFGQNILQVGKIDGVEWQMDPVGININGFAWHPHEAGIIAYAKTGTLNSLTTDLVVEDYTRARVDSKRFRLEAPGRLRLWGSWGAAFDEPGPAPLTTVATFEGESFRTSASGSVLTVLAEGLEGRAMGELGRNRIFIDGADEAVVVNTRTAVFEPNPYFDSTGEVMAMRGSPDGNFAVALVGGRGSSPDSGGKVILLPADPSSGAATNDLLFVVQGRTSFDWSPDGRFVAGYQPAVLGSEGDRVSAASVTVFDLEKGLFVGRELRSSGKEIDIRFDVGALAFQETLND